MKAFTFLLLTSIFGQPAFATENLATNAAEVFTATISAPKDGVIFDITATVTYSRPDAQLSGFGVKDYSGLACLRFATNPPPVLLKPGDLVHARGKTVLRTHNAHARCSEITVLRHGQPPEPKDVSLNEFATRSKKPASYDNALIRISGTIIDIFRDDIDARYTYIVFSDGKSSVCATCENDLLGDLAPEHFIGRKASVTGRCCPVYTGQARRLSRTIAISGMSDIAFLDEADANPFSSETLPASESGLFPTTSHLKRYRAVGQVTAVWQGKELLLRTSEGFLVHILLINPHPPKYGSRIEAVGFLENDCFQTVLSKSVWRLLTTSSDNEEEPTPVTAEMLVSDGQGHPQINPSFNGKTVKLVGKVTNLPAEKAGDGRFLVESDGFFIQVDSSSCPSALQGVLIGSVIEVCGTCVTEISGARTPWSIPHATNNNIVLRTEGDVRIVAYPPWWTPQRLSIVIVTLVLVVIAVVILSEAFRRLAEHRGKALANEAIMRAEADFKIYERTRLAIELHDSISQNLTGVSMEIDTAERFADHSLEKMREHLSLASRTLHSCRVELRNCLWDLRNHALELDDVNEAICQTLEPQIGDTKLSVRFNIKRDMLSDNTMHTILKIIRELVSNAIRHGKATSIRVAGSIKEDKLLFSVQDNGCGFDPDRSPGMDEGHFGLQGIRERVDNFEGEMEISSVLKSGTKITISIKIPQGAG